jgi:DUF1680 family protein
MLMMRTVLIAVVATLATSVPPAHDYAIRAVPATAVKIEDQFWAPKLETNRTVTIPHILKQNEDTGRVANFEKAAGRKPGPYEGRRFNDTDVYKIIEAASYSLALVPDPALSRKVDALIELIAASQEKDGYLMPARTIDPAHPAPGLGAERWTYENGSHELYNAGHLYEAGVAHFQATGKKTLLDVAIRNADLVAETFGPKGRQAVPGHEEIEIGLVKMFRATGKQKYLGTAEYFIAERGRPHPDMKPYTEKAFEMYNERAYKQDHLPVAEQDRAVGHAVRAMYLYAGVADVAALTDSNAYAVAADRLWRDVVSRRIYITGGLGSRGTTESFGEDYELPNRTAYTETCASVGNDLWNQRMFLLHGEGRYIDVLERALYNGVLSGVSVKGDTFFYQNPLESTGRAKRSEYFDVACCPANLARLLEQIPGLVYAQTDDTLFVNLYVTSRAKVKVGGRNVEVRQETRYPWSGEVTLRVDPDHDGIFGINVRVPGWARNEPVPGDLYRFDDDVKDVPAVSVAGDRGAPPSRQGRVLPGRSSQDPEASGGRPDIRNGYVRIRRAWRKGDVVTITLPMPVRRVAAHAGVKDDEGKIALQRGPLVYAFEAVDNGGKISDLTIARDAKLSSAFRADLLGGVEVIAGTASRPVVAVPYYAWGNRDQGEMAVWVKR